MFKFETHGKLIYGMPYVARIKLDIDSTLKKEFIETNANITSDGEVDIKLEYEAKDFEIIEERYGSCGPDVLGSYSIAFKGKLITLGESGNKDLEEKIINYLEDNFSIGILLNSIDDMIKDQFEDEINEILNSKNETVSTDKKNYIDILAALKKFIKDNESIMLQFSDFHVIFESNVEKIIMNFVNENLVYVECKNFKINIMLDKIVSYEATNSKYDFSRINIYMRDGATITLIKPN